jgi:heterodisulfide reductase subunit A
MAGWMLPLGVIREHTDAEVFTFYIDIRTPGNGFEEFYYKLLSEGVHFVRGKVAEVTDWALDPSEEGKLVIRVEDTLIGRVRRIPVDMVVLAVGLEARADAEAVRRQFNISCSTECWFLERHPSRAGNVHRRNLPGGLLPGTQGHSRYGSASGRRGGRSPGAD